MTKPKTIEILIPPDGRTARHIYSEEAAAITQGLGATSIHRASHVEPTGELSQGSIDWLREHRPALFDQNQFLGQAGDWWADMQVSGGPVLGPFGTREAALVAETTWLHERHLPVCQRCAGHCATAK